MTVTIKELIVVLAIAATIFRFAQPIALRYSTHNDFSRRRNVWFVLTITAFLSPNFWLFALVALPVLAWAGRKDANPVALYLLMLLVVPDIPMDIPAPGINRLFPLDIYRLLSICVLIPTSWRLWRARNPVRGHGLTVMDVLLLAYGALQVVLFIPPDLHNHVILEDSATNVLRRAFLFFVDVYVLYYVVSRFCSDRRTIAEAMAAFCLSCAVAASVAFFEFLRHWLLYVDIAVRWSHNPSAGFYLGRGEALRAQASAGHPLALGYLLAIAFGLWLYIQSQIKSTRTRFAVSIIYWLGLLAAYSRGPWIGAIVIYFAFVTVGPRPLSRLVRAVGIVGLIGGVVALSPLGQRIINVLPFMGGTIDSGSALYREQLARTSWEVIQQHPFFGDQLAVFKMRNMRQGEGIVDVVNTYAQVALNFGLVGLFLFVSFMLVGLFKAYRVVRQMILPDPDLALVGAGLVACALGALLMMSSISFILGVEKLFYVLAGLAAAYARLKRSTAPDAPNPHYRIRAYGEQR